MHYPSHMRDRFLDWVDAGYPPAAVVERNYEEHEVPAEPVTSEQRPKGLLRRPIRRETV